jgi:hypothetical protein
MILIANEKGSCAANTEALANQNTKQTQFTGQGNQLQVVAERMDAFNRLQRAFSKVGWNFHYLDGDACLAVHRKWQMSQVCPDLRSANALLRRIGGAV